MKKIFFGIVALVAMVATSCQQSLDELNVVGGGDATVTFNVGAGSRAYSDGKTATNLQWAVYAVSGEGTSKTLSHLTALNGNKTFNLSTTVEFQLTTGNKYAVIFWADANNSPYTVNFGPNGAEMTVDYTGAKTKSNDENRDAFYKYHEFTVSGSQTESVELKRPFAQLNIGTSDLTASANAGYTVSHVKVEVPAYSTLDLVSGEAEDVTTAVLFDYAEIPTTETFPVSGYQYMAMNYVLVNSVKETFDVKFTYATDATGTNAKERTVGSVPFQRNHRTNLYGQLLTSDVAVNVEIKPEYDDAFNNEGFFVTTNANGEIITVTALSAKGLATIADQIADGTLSSDVDIVLNSNIDLAELASRAVASNWTPIGTSANPFKGTFDGKGFKVSNLVIDGGSNSNIGFFGVTHNGEIKNLVIENAKVSGRLNVGVVAGTPYTSKYSNITVTGHVEVDGMAYVGAVGGKNAYANWSNITVDVDETSYVNANSVENGTAYRTYVGGVIGFCGEGGHSFSNIYSNINVKGSTCDVGGIVGIAHYGNNFVNCVCEGDVEIYNASEEADAQEIGGLAGVWHNENGTQVTFTNCQFTGELKANNGYVIDTNKFGNLVCAAYGKGTGVLNIDGKLYTVAAPGETVNGSVVADNTEEGQAALKDNAANGKDVILVSDVTTIDSGSNGYGATGINVNGGTLDGNGYTLEVNGATSTWDSAVAISSGTIKNITIAKGFRGIFIKTTGTGEPVILDNVTINGPTYTISCDQASKQGIIATNCTIMGWTSFAGTIGWAKFTNCTFGEGAGYNFSRPYAPTTYVNCNFESGHRIDPRAAVTFENCTVAGVALTAENLSTLVSNTANATVVK